MSTRGHEEHRSMDHEAEREAERSPEELNEEKEHHERVNEVVHGGSREMVHNFEIFLARLEHNGEAADQLVLSERIQYQEEGKKLPDFPRDPPPDPFVGDSDKDVVGESFRSIRARAVETAHGADNDNLEKSRKTIATRGTDLVDGTHTKRWYVRWKFWEFIGASEKTVSSDGAALFAGLALHSHPKPDDPNFDAIKSARDQMKRWRDLPDGALWLAFKSYVQTKRLSLETQQALAQYVQMYFPSPWTPVADGEATRVRDELIHLYYANVATGPDVPSCAIYERLSQGLRVTDATSHQTVTLPRSQAAAIAEMTLFELMQQRGAK
jgi:hypothetical protein